MERPTPMTAGITERGSSVSGQSWYILGQTYTPLYLTESSFGWHAMMPAGTFVSPHVHPTQDQFIQVLSGTLDVLLDGQASQATAGDLVRLPRCVPHGLYNRTETDIACLVWVSPTRLLWDLFQAIHAVRAPHEVARLAGMHQVIFLPLDF